MLDVTVRPLTDDDSPWLLGLARAQAVRQENHAPTFWRPARNARALHQELLSARVAAKDAVAVRTDHAAAIGVRGPHRLTVEDFMCERGEHYSTDGKAVLAALAERDALLVSVPRHEPRRRSVVETLGGVVDHTWWNKDIDRDDVMRVALDLADCGVKLVGTQPIYDADGPVAFFPSVPTLRHLHGAMPTAYVKGARTVVVRQAVGDDSSDLAATGFVALVDFFRIDTP